MAALGGDLPDVGDPGKVSSVRYAHNDKGRTFRELDPVEVDRRVGASLRGAHELAVSVKRVFAESGHVVFLGQDQGFGLPRVEGDEPAFCPP